MNYIVSTLQTDTHLFGKAVEGPSHQFWKLCEKNKQKFDSKCKSLKPVVLWWMTFVTFYYSVEHSNGDR